jgi:hypothetical protein
MTTNSGIILPDNYEFFDAKLNYGLTQKQLEEQKRTAEFIQWGRRNPVLFAEQIFGISLMDYQKYVFMNTWNAQFIVWCMGRNSGKSILGAIYLMTRTLLVDNFSAYILCGVGSQSIELFSKIEKLTFNAIPSFKTLTDVFQGEVVKNQANSNGFTHNPSSYQFHLYNNSACYTLNGAYDNNRSKRSNCNFYDECMNSPDELFETSEPFCTQNSEFGDGVDYDATDALIEPPMFPNQLIYASSAGRTDQYLFRKYRECSLRMDAGDKRYFCADINADTVIKATKGGILMPKPLLTQEVVDARMREDKEAGLREYANIFTSEGGDGQIIKRADIIRNSVPRVPDLKNKDNRSKYLILYDPARLYDRSVVLVAEVIYDEFIGWKARIVNVISLVDMLTKSKTPMNTPNQVKALKQIILDYNGEGVADYENILAILVDAGSGGAGVPITDFLCEDWEDSNGVIHRGIIDSEFRPEEKMKSKFPNAIDGILHLISPAKYKSDLFEALIKMIQQNLIEFTEEYMNKGYLNLIYEKKPDGKMVQRYTYPSEKEEKELRKKGITVENKIKQLDFDEEIALKQIDLMKNELVNIYRFKQSTGKDRFDLAPDKIGKLNDDKAYCCALLGYELSCMRRTNITGKKKKSTSNLADILPIRTAKRHSYFD